MTWQRDGILAEGGSGNDTLAGGTGNDQFVDDPGSDLLAGGAGDDVLDSAEGADSFAGGPGDDVILAGDPTAGQTILMGLGDGRDVATLVLGYCATVRLSAPVASFAVGGDGDLAARLADSDLLVRLADGTALYLPFAGLPWDDDAGRLDRVAIVAADRTWTLREALTVAVPDRAAVAAFDAMAGLWREGVTLAGSDGADTLAGGAQADSLYGGAGNDLVAGGGREDRLAGDAGDDRLEGGLGHDLLDGGTGNDLLLGGEGDDLIVAGAGNDTIDGGAGEDWLDVSGTTGRVFTIDLMQAKLVDAGRDGVFGIEHVIGSAWGEGLIGSDGANSLLGGGGNDQIWANGGNDDAFGEDGADTLKGGVGQDALFGQAGDDTVDGQGGNDSLSGGGGADLLVGGAGADRFLVDAGDGMVTVADFVRGSDRLVLSGFGFAAAGEARGLAIVAGADLRLQLDGDTALLLRGLAAGGLADADIQLL
ncbi:MAG: calcium-binding protein [Geminicoccaceae bacterium]